MTEIIGVGGIGKEDKQPIGAEAQCWSCNNIWNISLLPIGTKGVKCTCGGYVVTPSGKIMARPIYDEFESTAPLLELGDNEQPIILTDDVIASNGAITKRFNSNKENKSNKPK